MFKSICTVIFLSVISVPEIFSTSHLSYHRDSTEILLYEFREAFFDIPFYLDTLTVTDSFEYFEENDESRCIYFNFGPFQCYFYSEPGKNLSISLPDDSEIDPEWQTNPYYVKVTLHVKVRVKNPEKGITGLNRAIREFDREYDPFLSKQALRFYNAEYARERLDSFITVNYKEKIRVTDNKYFNLYRSYKKAILYYHSNQQNIDSLISRYLWNKPVKFNNPAYRTFFSYILTGYFDYLRRKIEFTGIYSEFTRLSLGYLREYLSNDPLLSNDTILETVLLKECYEAFYRGDIKEDRLISFVKEVKEDSPFDFIQKTADELIKKFTHLRTGYPSPELFTTDVTGDSVKISKNNDRLIYLAFCDLSSIDCLRELEYLKYLHAKHNRFIQIVTFLKSHTEEKLVEFAKQKEVNWNVLSWHSNQKFIDAWDVRAVPSFFLIDRNGKFLRSPAPNPSENFEHELFLILRSKGEV